MAFGKPLKGMFNGLFDYRYGDYRNIYALESKEKNILTLRVGHKKVIYNQKTLRRKSFPLCLPF
jgi:mRNA-degrading endonuclease RelE of RelBE toxin-antitoxin system